MKRSYAVPLIAGLAGLTLAGGIATAASKAPSPVKACTNAKHVLTLLSGGKCAKGSHLVSIGVTGPRGAQGAQGIQGVQGVQGTQGIQGIQGKTGPSHLVQYNVSAPATGTGGASGDGVVTLATAGPFTLIGKCTTNAGSTYAQTYLRTSVDHAVMDDYEGNSFSDFSTTSAGTAQTGGTAVPGDALVGYSASSTGTAAFTGPNDGSTAAMSPDRVTTVNAFTNAGVFVGVGAGGTPPPCTFSGYIVTNAVP